MGLASIYIPVFLAAMLLASNAASQEPLTGTLETMDPRAIGLGGATRVNPAGTSGVYLNPASIAMSHLYHFNLMYEFTGEEKMHNAGIAIVDSVTSTSIAAGLALNYLRTDQSHTDHESWDARLALAANFGEVFFLGMTGRYLRVEADLEGGDRGPNGRPAMPSSGSQQVDGFTFDAGAALRLANIVSIGITGYNLTDTGSVYAPIKLGTGVGVSLFEMLLIEADLVMDFTTHEDLNERIHAGAELFLGGKVPLRIGYIYDVLYNLNTLAAGLGYVDSAFAIDFGFQHEVVKGGRFQLAFGIRIFIG